MCITFCKQCGSRMSDSVTDRFCSVECFEKFDESNFMSELMAETFPVCFNCYNPECDGCEYGDEYDEEFPDCLNCRDPRCNGNNCITDLDLADFFGYADSM